MHPFTQLFIDGQWRPSSTNETFEIRNPQSNVVVGTCASASSQDCKDAVEAAARAFKTWEHVSLSDKRDIFIKAADILRDKYTDKVIAAIGEEIAVLPYMAHFNLSVSTVGLCPTDGTTTLSQRLPIGCCGSPQVLSTS
jgi:hypothetical protein